MHLPLKIEDFWITQLGCQLGSFVRKFACSQQGHASGSHFQAWIEAEQKEQKEQKEVRKRP